MSINNSYFSRNNTLISNSLVNSGRNPVTELFYGDGSLVNPIGFTRFIFDLDLTLLKEKYQSGIISEGCNTNTTHTLRMTNTSYFDKELLNTSTSQGRLRATSFDLILFRIPYVNFNENQPQNWDEGVGYDYYDLVTGIPSDKNYSDRPSNWSATTTITDWQQPGIYSNTNTGSFNYNQLEIVATQHFEFGDENVEFDMTDEINSILDGSLINTTGWGIAYLPQVENLTGTTGNYSVGFFTRHTQTFYEPFLETNYDDSIEDDRNSFSLGKINKLYLYIFEDGDFQNLDNNPLVTISDQSGTPIPGLVNMSSCQVTKGVYEITIPPLLGYKTPCIFTDTWSDISLNGFSLPDVINEFAIYPLKKSIQIGTTTNDPSVYGFDYYGIKQDEKILNTDIRKVGVIIKKAYTVNQLLPKVEGYYRVYVREGQTEVQVQDWTKLNRTPNEYYFIFDTRDKIPNEYYIDLKVISSGEVNTYKRQIKFQIVNKK
jgi:hypothetical protein